MGNESVEFDLDGRIKKLGNDRVDYDLDSRIRQIGDMRIDYDLSGRIKSIRGGNNRGGDLIRRYRLVERANRRAM